MVFNSFFINSQAIKKSVAKKIFIKQTPVITEKTENFNLNIYGFFSHEFR